MPEDSIRCFTGKNPAIDAWGAKYNFVDARNSVIGFDAEQSCCEHFFYCWLNSDKEILKDYEPETLPGYYFDTDYFYEGGPDKDHDEFDEGGFVEFRAVNPTTGETLYLQFHNSHNGYYSHGFNFLNHGNSIQSGSI